MARTKTKVYRVTAFLNQAQHDALQSLMTESMADTASQYLRNLIAETWRTRTLEKSRRPVGRPRRDDSAGQSSDTRAIEDEPRNIPHPDQFSDANRGTFMTQSEYDEWLDNHPWHKERLKRQS